MAPTAPLRLRALEVKFRAFLTSELMKACNQRHVPVVVSLAVESKPDSAARITVTGMSTGTSFHFKREINFVVRVVKHLTQKVARCVARCQEEVTEANETSFRRTFTTWALGLDSVLPNFRHRSDGRFYMQGQRATKFRNPCSVHNLQ
jgi:hypothetical protein